MRRWMRSAGLALVGLAMGGCPVPTDSLTMEATRDDLPETVEPTGDIDTNPTAVATPMPAVAPTNERTVLDAIDADMRALPLGVTPSVMRDTVRAHLQERADVAELSPTSADGLIAARFTDGSIQLFEVSAERQEPKANATQKVSQASQTRGSFQSLPQFIPYRFSAWAADAARHQFGVLGQNDDGGPLSFPSFGESGITFHLPHSNRAVMLRDYDPQFDDHTRASYQETTSAVARMLAARGYRANVERLDRNIGQQIAFHSVVYLFARTGEIEWKDTDKTTHWIFTSEAYNGTAAQDADVRQRLLIVHNTIQRSETGVLEWTSRLCLTPEYIRRDVKLALKGQRLGDHKVIFLNGDGFRRDGSSPYFDILAELGDGAQFLAWGEDPGQLIKATSGTAFFRYCTGGTEEVRAAGRTLLDPVAPARRNVSLLKAYEMLHQRGWNQYGGGAELRWRSDAPETQVVTLAPAIHGLRRVSVAGADRTLLDCEAPVGATIHALGSDQLVKPRDDALLLEAHDYNHTTEIQLEFEQAGGRIVIEDHGRSSVELPILAWQVASSIAWDSEISVLVQERGSMVRMMPTDDTWTRWQHYLLGDYPHASRDPNDLWSESSWSGFESQPDWFEESNPFGQMSGGCDKLRFVGDGAARVETQSGTIAYYHVTVEDRVRYTHNNGAELGVFPGGMAAGFYRTLTLDRDSLQLNGTAILDLHESPGVHALLPPGPGADAEVATCGSSLATSWRQVGADGSEEYIRENVSQAVRADNLPYERFDEIPR